MSFFVKFLHRAKRVLPRHGCTHGGKGTAQRKKWRPARRLCRTAGQLWVAPVDLALLLRVLVINASIAAANLLDQLDLDSKAMRFLRQVSSRLSLSARGCHRMLRVARTVADLSDLASVKVQHLEETYQFIKPCQELQFAGE